MTTDTSFAPGSLLGPLTVTDLLLDGGAVARENNKVIFLDHGVPGDTLMARVTQNNKSFCRAKVADFLEQSSHTVAPWCISFGKCGGCVWQHIDPLVLLAWKERQIKETLNRVGGIAIPVEPVVPSPTTTRFRTRVTYAFGMGEEGPALGLRARTSHKIVPIGECGLQPDSAQLLKKLRHSLLENAQLPVWENNDGYLRFAIFHTPNFTGLVDELAGKQRFLEIIVAPENAPGQHAKATEALHSLLDSGTITGFALSVRKSRAAVAQGEKVVCTGGRCQIAESYGPIARDVPLLFPFQSFMQTNTCVTELLLETMQAQVPVPPEACIWDIYCGVGIMGFALARKDSTLFGADMQKSSVALAKNNSQRLGLDKSHFAAGLLAKSLLKAPDSPDIIIIDPPRAGIEDCVVQKLRSQKKGIILYISCDIATQARDIKSLCAGPDPVWRAVKAIPFDMFPATPHIENLVVLEYIP